MEKYVESTTLIGQIVREYPEAIEVLNEWRKNPSEWGR